jgi:hypothetical protein
VYLQGGGVSTYVYCERCDRLIDSYEDDDQLQEAYDVCVACDDREDDRAEQENREAREVA